MGCLFNSVRLRPLIILNYYIVMFGECRFYSIFGANYFLTIVADFSRGVLGFLLKHKDEIGKCLINFYNLIKTQFGKEVRKIRSDNEGEFTNQDMIHFYNKEGILLETTCPHTLQQNKVVERKHSSRNRMCP